MVLEILMRGSSTVEAGSIDECEKSESRELRDERYSRGLVCGCASALNSEFLTVLLEDPIN